MSTKRSTVSTTLTVDRLDNTRWPVSAAWSAAHADGASPISLTMITSGSWRSACTSADSRARRVGSHLALVDDGALVGVQHLDRILDRDDVALPGAVHVVDHRGERRRLPGAGETGDEHETVRLVGERGDGGRQRQRFEAGDAGQHAAQHETHPPALAERAHPEAPEPGDAVHEVGLVRGLGTRRARASGMIATAHTLGLGGFDGVERRLAQPAVDAQARPRAHLDVHVGSALLDGEAQQSIEVQHLTAVSTSRRGCCSGASG